MTRAASQNSRPRVRRAFVAGFAVLYVTWLVLGVVDDLVWMPQLIAPAYSLDQIYAVLTRAGSAPGVVVAPVLWLVFWSIVGAAYVVVLLPGHRRFRGLADSTSLVTVVGCGLTVFGAMAFFQWWSGFGMGMEVSDELPPFVGNTTPFGLFCFAGGALIALVGGILWIIGGARAGRVRIASAAAGSPDAAGGSR